MRRGPLVSCIMPSMRSGAPLARALDSFAEQTYQHKELVIVSTAVERSLEFRYANVRVVPVRPDGPALGELRNIAIRNSWGSIICTMDDDDASAPDRLERIVDAFRANKMAMWSGSSLVTVVEEASGKAWEWDGLVMMDELAQLYGATLAFRRELWERNPFDPWRTNGEDVEWMRAIGECRRHDFRDPTMTTHFIGRGDSTGHHRPCPPCYREIAL